MYQEHPPEIPRNSQKFYNKVLLVDFARLWPYLAIERENYQRILGERVLLYLYHEYIEFYL